jgi:hypothetical protein
MNSNLKPKSKTLFINRLLEFAFMTKSQFRSQWAVERGEHFIQVTRIPVHFFVVRYLLIEMYRVCVF